MAIVKNINQIKDHLPFNEDFDFAVIKGFVEEVENKYVEDLIGTGQYNVFDTKPVADPQLKVYLLFEKAIANLSAFRYVPIGNIQISNGGIVSMAGQHTKSAEWWQIRDLQRSFLTSGFEAIDFALKNMEKNKAQFSAWTTSENYTEFNELFVNRTDIFQRYQNINDSRRTFLALRPLLLECQQQYFNWLGQNTIDLIKAAGNNFTKQALGYCQAAQANFAVAKAAANGLFSITATGLFLRITEIKGEKSESLNDDQLRKLMKDRLNSGNEYIKMLKNYIDTNPSQFPDYMAPVSTGQFPAETVNTKSIVSF